MKDSATSGVAADARLAPPTWSAAAPPRRQRVRVALVGIAGAAAAFAYLAWLLRPDRVGQPVLFLLLVVAELFNVVHALGFWWTCGRAGDRPHRPARDVPDVDVLIP